MTGHTPGPYRVEPMPQNMGGCRNIQAFTPPVMAKGVRGYYTNLACTVGLGDDKKDAANARLFAAAPDTAAERDRLREVNAEALKALRSMLDLYLHGPPPSRTANSVINNTYDVVRKLEGST